MQENAIETRRLETPDQLLDMKDRGGICIVRMADGSAGMHAIPAPGWTWETDEKPLLGSPESCPGRAAQADADDGRQGRAYAARAKRSGHVIQGGGIRRGERLVSGPPVRDRGHRPHPREHDRPRDPRRFRRQAAGLLGHRLRHGRHGHGLGSEMRTVGLPALAFRSPASGKCSSFAIQRAMRSAVGPAKRRRFRALRKSKWTSTKRRRRPVRRSSNQAHQAKARQHPSKVREYHVRRVGQEEPTLVQQQQPVPPVEDRLGRREGAPVPAGRRREFRQRGQQVVARQVHPTVAATKALRHLERDEFSPSLPQDLRRRVCAVEPPRLRQSAADQRSSSPAESRIWWVISVTSRSAPGSGCGVAPPWGFHAGTPGRTARISSESTFTRRIRVRAACPQGRPTLRD